MAAVLVLRIPFWRTFVIEIPERHQIFHDLTSMFRRKIRHKIFDEIEAGNDAAAILLAEPKGLKRWRGEWDDSPLIAAIGNGRSELACKLLEIGGSFKNDGALEIATMKGDLIVVKALLAFGKNPDETNTKSDFNKGYTSLMWATNRNHILVMEALLTAGANVDAVAEDGTTAAMLTRKGDPKNIEALEVLCRYKPNITIKDWRKRNLVREALDLEQNSSRPEMRLLLERYYPKALFDTVKK